MPRFRVSEHLDSEILNTLIQSVYFVAFKAKAYRISFIDFSGLLLPENFVRITRLQLPSAKSAGTRAVSRFGLLSVSFG